MNIQITETLLSIMETKVKYTDVTLQEMGTIFTCHNALRQDIIDHKKKLAEPPVPPKAPRKKKAAKKPPLKSV